MPRSVIIAVLSFWSITGWAANNSSCADLVRTQPLNLLVSEIYSQPLDQENSFVLEFKTHESNIQREVDILKAVFRKRRVKVNLQSVVELGKGSLVGVEISGKGQKLLLALIDLSNLKDLNQRFENLVWLTGPVSAESTSVMRKPIPQLNLPRPVVKSLLRNDIYFVGDLVSVSYSDLVLLPAIGKVARGWIVNALEELGLKPGTEVPGWPYPDIDPYDVTYPSGRMPQIPTWLWQDTEKKNARSILSRSLKITRPIILLYNPEGPINDPSGMIALINEEFFTNNRPEEIYRYIESHAEDYTMRGIAYSLVGNLATWKQKGIESFETVSIAQLMGDKSPEWVRSVGESQAPLRMEVGDKTIIVIPILPR